MDSSPGFGSTPRDCVALFRLAFAPAPPSHWLNLATEGNSPAHSSIGTLADVRRRPSTARKHTVSGTISLPFRGAFHLSLTVLVRYRSLRVFSLGRWASLLPTHFLVLRGTSDQPATVRRLSPTGLSPSLAARSRDLPLDGGLVTVC